MCKLRRITYKLHLTQRASFQVCEIFAGVYTSIKSACLIILILTSTYCKCYQNVSFVDARVSVGKCSLSICRCCVTLISEWRKARTSSYLVDRQTPCETTVTASETDAPFNKYNRAFCFLARVGQTYADRGLQPESESDSASYYKHLKQYCME